MNDHESPLTPDQDREVRRLLAGSRHEEPMPPEVVARLDRVLNDLGSEPSREATVAQLATRRRRVTALLVAAAAVVAVGVGVERVVGPGTSLMDAGGDSTSADQPTAADGLVQQRDSDDGAEREGPEAGAAEPAPEPEAALERSLIRVRPRAFADDARTAQSYALQDSVIGSLTSDEALRATCRSGTWGSGTFVPVRYGSLPGVLVFRRPSGDTQVVDLFLCGGTEPLRTLSLPAP